MAWNQPSLLLTKVLLKAVKNSGRFPEHLEQLCHAMQSLLFKLNNLEMQKYFYLKTQQKQWKLKTNTILSINFKTGFQIPLLN